MNLLHAPRYRKIVPLMFLALFLCALAPLHGQQVYWSQLSGPPAGEVGALVSDSAGYIYAGSSAGVRRSSDGGRSWHDVLPAGTVAAMATLPSGTVVAYQSTYDGPLRGPTIYRSSDHGMTWESYPFKQRSLSIARMTALPSGTLIATTLPSLGSRVPLRSTDGGITWQEIPGGPRNLFGKVLITSAGPLLAGGYNNKHDLIYRSTDDGITWDSLSYERPPLTILQLDEVRPGVILALTSGRESLVSRSTDGGTTWSDIPITAIPVRGLHYPYGVISHLPDGRVMAVLMTRSMRIDSNYISAHYVVGSDDAGLTWKLLDTTSLADAISFGTMLSLPDGSALLPTSNMGIYVSRDNGGSWSNTHGLFDKWRNSPLYISDDGTLYTFRIGLYRSDDRGENWRRVRFAYSPAFALGKDGHIGMAMSLDSHTHRLFYSTDKGDSWDTTVAPARFQSLAFSPSGELFGGSREGLFRTSDHGRTWQQILPKNYADSSTVREFVITSRGAIVALLDPKEFPPFRAGLYYSPDGGTTWQAGDSRINLAYYGLAVSPNDEIYLRYDYPIQELFRSADNGASFSSIPGPPSYNFILDLCFNQIGHLFCSITPEGVFRSVDDGASWIPVNYGLRTFEAVDLTPAPDGYLYAVSEGKIYRSTVSTSAVPSPRPHPTGSAITVAPNPSTGETAITFRMPQAGHATLELHDALGRTVARLADGTFDAGEQTVRWDGTSLPSGVYSLRLLTSDGVENGRVVLKR